MLKSAGSLMLEFLLMKPQVNSRGPRYFSTECNLVSSGHPMGKAPLSAVYLESRHSEQVGLRSLSRPGKFPIYPQPQDKEDKCQEHRVHFRMINTQKKQ